MHKIIVFGHKHIFTNEGGIEVVVSELYPRLSNDFQIVVLDRKDNGTKYPYDAGNIHVVGIPTAKNKKLNAAIYSFLATLYCIIHKADVVHIHAEGQCGFLPLLRLFRPHTPVIVTVHGIDWQRAKWGGFATKYLRFSERMAVKYADEITVLSNHDANYFVRTYNAKNIRIIPNGASKPVFASPRTLYSHSIEPAKYILYIGRFAPEKRVDLLLHAYAASQAKSKYSLVLAGPVADTPQLKESAEKIPGVILVNNATGELKEALLTWAKLYVLPSDLEGLSMSLLEALTYGDLTLCSDIPENIEVHQNSTTFLHTFRHGDIVDLTAKIDILLSENRAVPGMAKDGDDAMLQSNLFCSFYDWDAVAEQYKDLFKEVMNHVG
ncbi:MAG: glycosyltransferase family 4 protein [Lactimicrobium massiliense]|nr:glycosyltransferase family 4 protein [Lactimicrobium massiliense]MDD6560750.1 glycosyltransferase family 4 protein [Lactimicrobium massiliense]